MATGRPGLRLATEEEFAQAFPDCEPGAKPPVGGQTFQVATSRPSRSDQA